MWSDSTGCLCATLRSACPLLPSGSSCLDSGPGSYEGLKPPPVSVLLSGSRPRLWPQATLSKPGSNSRTPPPLGLQRRFVVSLPATLGANRLGGGTTKSELLSRKSGLVSRPTSTWGSTYEEIIPRSANTLKMCAKPRKNTSLPDDMQNM